MKYCFVIFQSVLKNIPVVGSLFGWFVSSLTSGSKGRAFSLQSGKFLNQVHFANFIKIILWYTVFLSIQLFNFCMYIHNINPLRTMVAYMRQENKYFTVCKQIIITLSAFTL